LVAHHRAAGGVAHLLERPLADVQVVTAHVEQAVGQPERQPVEDAPPAKGVAVAEVDLRQTEDDEADDGEEQEDREQLPSPDRQTLHRTLLRGSDAAASARSARSARSAGATGTA